MGIFLSYDKERRATCLDGLDLWCVPDQASDNRTVDKHQGLVEALQVVKRVMNITPSQLQMLLHDAMKRLSLSQTELGTLTNMLEGTKIVNMNLQEQISGMDMGVLKIEEAKFQVVHVVISFYIFA